MAKDMVVAAWRFKDARSDLCWLGTLALSMLLAACAGTPRSSQTEPVQPPQVYYPAYPGAGQAGYPQGGQMYQPQGLGVGQGHPIGPVQYPAGAGAQPLQPSVSTGVPRGDYPPPPSQSTITQYSDYLFDGPEGRGFAYYLAMGYRQYAKHEDNAHDFEDAAKFLHRAGAVERGEKVEPEHISMRILPPWAIDDLIYARQRLTRALSLGAGQRLPKVAAAAQVAFDCWMEQQEENIQPHDVVKCRSEFENQIVRLEGLFVQPKRLQPQSAPAPVPCPPEKPALPAACGAQAYLLHFQLDRHEVSSIAQETLRNAVAALNTTSEGRLELMAHADRAGSDAHNDRLSQRRLQAVVEVLEGMGVPKERITVARFYGESQPKVPTADGVREQANRRVEVRVVCNQGMAAAQTGCPAQQAEPCRATCR